MRQVIAMCVLVGLAAGCETRGVLVSEYSAGGGNHVRLERYSHGRQFFYSLSARQGPHSCGLRRLKIVAMGDDGALSLRVLTDAQNTCT